MAEQWMRWEPCSGLAGSYDLESISDDIEGLKIVFIDIKDQKRNIQVIFKDSVLAYRKTNESFRLRTIHDFSDQYNTKLYGDWTFFKINNSSYKLWLLEQSHEMKALLDCTHFCLVAYDDFIDVIATSEPKIEFIE